MNLETDLDDDVELAELLVEYTSPPPPRPVLARPPMAPSLGVEQSVSPAALAPVFAEPASQHVTLAAYVRGIDVHTALVVGAVALGLGLGIGWLVFGGKALGAAGAVAAL